MNAISTNTIEIKAIKELGNLLDVFYLEQVACDVFIYGKLGNHILHKISLDGLDSELVHQGFIMANNKTLVNTQNIECFYLGNNRSILLNNGTQIKISRRKLHLFKELVKEKGIR